MSEDWGNQFFDSLEKREDAKRLSDAAGYESEHLQNVRRTLESGLRMAQHPPMESGYIDLFTHALDELRRARVDFPDS